MQTPELGTWCGRCAGVCRALLFVLLHGHELLVRVGLLVLAELAVVPLLVVLSLLGVDLGWSML
jgi:hypothetical protein